MAVASAGSSQQHRSDRRPRRRRKGTAAANASPAILGLAIAAAFAFVAPLPTRGFAPRYLSLQSFASRRSGGGGEGSGSGFGDGGGGWADAARRRDRATSSASAASASACLWVGRAATNDVGNAVCSPSALRMVARVPSAASGAPWAGADAEPSPAEDKGPHRREDKRSRGGVIAGRGGGQGRGRGRGGRGRGRGRGGNAGGKKRRVRNLFREAKDLERLGRWREASAVLRRIVDDIDPRDAHSHLALARLEARREGGRGAAAAGASKKKGADAAADDDDDSPAADAARAAFERGISLCPDSVHLWQAWALHEQSRGDDVRARELFERALQLGSTNPYVCHAYGLMELRLGNADRARALWEGALGEDEGEGSDHGAGVGKSSALTATELRMKKGGRSTAALVCSLGELHVSAQRYDEARDLYARHVLLLDTERELTEVYLAAAWLEERYFHDMDRAAELLASALRLSPGNSRAQIAIARLEGRRAAMVDGMSEEDRTKEVRKRLVDACTRSRIGSEGRGSSVRDGRLFNAWAKLEVRAGRLAAARKILKRGMQLFPNDHSLVQAAGKVEERVGNYTLARDLYTRSLAVEPSAPTLVAYALLELAHPDVCSLGDKDGAAVAAAAAVVAFPGTVEEFGNDGASEDNDGNEDEDEHRPDTRKAFSLFEEALLIDPRHGPTYNAYGNSLLKHGGSIDEARAVYERGVASDPRDPASVYHGLARLELEQGNVERAREVLNRGLDEVQRLEAVMDNRKRGRAAFLAHTLGMLELNSHRVQVAKEVFEAGLERHGNSSSQLLLGAALCEVRLGNDYTARKFFDEAVHADRRHAQAWQAWGVMEMRAGNYKTAKTLFECGIKSRPDHGALWQAYGTMESRRGDFDVARALFAAGIQKCPDHVPLYQAWACLELRGHNYDHARVLIGEALTRDKTEGSGWLVAGKIEEKQGNDGVAGLILRRGLECDPNNAELYRAIAEIEIKKGKIDDARDFLEKGLDVNPLHAPSYHTLAELEARVFNIEGLARLNKRAAKVFNANALASPSSSAAEDVWGKKIRASRPNARLPDGVAALVEEIGGLDLDLEHSLTVMDPESVIEGIHRIEGFSNLS